ncbi:MAG: cytochrome c biogenesis protein CcsA [Pirellulales bacterium]|nr:cytochrome c biogenesis protein CcsA [Pirellulales bacterium]
MATVEAPLAEPLSPATRPIRTAAPPLLGRRTRALLMPLASLRLTVALFALSIFLVLAGTLAQRFYDVWEPVGSMFRSFVAWVELRYFLPVAWYEPSPSVGFPFPGGWLIGGFLGVNLLAAHALRFKATARGARLALGLAILFAGLVATIAVIRSGLDDTLLSELSPRLANGLWHALRAALGGGALALAWAVAVAWPQVRGTSGRWLWALGGVVAALLLALTVALFLKPEWRLDPSGLRIMWQLIKGLGASVVLLAGCWLVFGQRGGIVLLHAGVMLLMGSELHTGLTAVESQMVVAEGETVAYAEDMRASELAIIDKSDPRTDRVVRVPLSLLQQAAAGADAARTVLDDKRLPVLVRPVQVLANSSIRWLQPGESSPATAGTGLLRTADPAPSSVGTDTEQRFDEPAAFVELLDRDSNASLGTYLLHPYLTPQVVATTGGKSYEASLRFRRIEKPYQVTLLQFKAENYVGSQTAKHYESLVRLTDASRDVDRTVPIWMNNPLRYAGDTLYQSGFDMTGRARTILQVMTNSGWLVPYLACVIVGVGMFAHFAGVMARFVRRREDEAQRELAAPENGQSPSAARGVWPRRSLLRDWRMPQVWVPLLVVLTLSGWARPPRESATQFRLSEFGALPAASNGRLLPLDTLARNTLMFISGRDAYDDANTDKKEPAIRWFAELASRAPGWQKHRVLRIENLDVLQTLGLPQRSGFRYGLDELMKSQAAYQKQVEQATTALVKSESRDKLELTQAKFLELADKVARVTMLLEAFAPHAVEGETQQEVLASLAAEQDKIERLNAAAPRALPPAAPAGQWQMPRAASFDQLAAAMAKQIGAKPQPTNPAYDPFEAVLAAYAKGNAGLFNERLADYRQFVAERAAAEAEYEASLAAAGSRGTRKFVERLQPERIAREAVYNRLGLFDACKAFYIVAFLLAAAAWLGWSEGFHRAANWLLWATFVVHTLALVARIYISGRPPVTNLYSSAVFIGWSAVLFSLLFETVYRLGIGNLLAAAVGFPSLVIASRLADGDTFTVMQAVLDTQFWLATHVVCISLGYTATFLAGFLGVFWIVLGRVGRVFDEGMQAQVTRMIYGTLCFAIFFSFVGTVLGGLWADDSWGRFWGWDPKENGALMIVLWNALVLHARWGKLVRPRGLAVLAVFGNVVTAWSWFGVNQLNIGLHSYGATSGIALALGAFAVSQLAIMAAAALPPRRAELAA